ncbi:molybdopterin molybdotransferase MoeA [Aestuariimicrobium ganziense]|uniref:molybdopterin molybdotransferase MoeA n=1 Tax=Aestuariimicrobium ganziense TaxID=2773677 RepID=UPI001945323C|nr:gephyrin-like molybdotransferase Glp [Aestuariimicrobium ganziense]
MRTVEEHLTAVLSQGRRLAPVQASGRACLGLVLADDLTARLAVPAFDNSSMDGYAVRAADVAGASPDAPVVLAVVGDQPAGPAVEVAVAPGTAVRIMTGAPMPSGADAIVPVEDTDQPRGAAALPDRVEVRASTEPGRFLRRAGDDTAPGDLVARAGSLVTPALLSSAVSVGHGTLSVVPRPRVWVISSGSELVDPGADLSPGMIPDSNGLLLAGLLEQFGAEVVAVDRVTDDLEGFAGALRQGPEVDLVVTTGGVSAGAFEVVREVTAGTVEFSEVAMQPGKPQGAGTVDVAGRTVAMLALPGNPVSVFVSAWLFVRPLLAVMAGRPTDLPTRRLPAGEAWRTPPARRQYLPAVVQDGRVHPAHRLGSGSHLVAALHRAEVLAVVDAEVDMVGEGDEVEVIDVRGQQ